MDARGEACAHRLLSMAVPNWRDAFLRYQTRRDLSTRTRHAPFSAKTVGSILTITPSSGHERRITQSEFEPSLPLPARAGRAPLMEASCNNSYIESIVDDLSRGYGRGADAPAGAALTSSIGRPIRDRQ
jgi:hypothetical protein